MRLTVSKLLILVLTSAAALSVCACGQQDGISQKLSDDIGYCAVQASKTLSSLRGPEQIPVCIPKDSLTWKCCTPGSWWTCGFWPGELWYLYEGTGDEKWKDAAIGVSDAMLPVAYMKATSHDVGFMIMPSIGNAYRLTGDEKYKDALISAADSLVTLYNPLAGTILSWPEMVAVKGWQHNTIIDNMRLNAKHPWINFTRSA